MKVNIMITLNIGLLMAIVAIVALASAALGYYNRCEDEEAHRGR